MEEKTGVKDDADTPDQAGGDGEERHRAPENPLQLEEKQTGEHPHGRLQFLKRPSIFGQQSDSRRTVGPKIQ